MIRRLRNLSVLSLLLLISIHGFAQSATTSLRGVVKDPSGAVVSGATITLVNKATAQTLAATSSKSGEFQLTQIPPAKYTISVTASGFGSQSKFAELLVAQPATINFTLTLQSSVEVVNVSAEAQTLNITDASLGGSTSNAEIQALPSQTRNVPDLLSLQPGVLFLPTAGSGDSRSGAVNGGRSDQGNVTLDGVDDNDQVSGAAFKGVLRETQDSVEEFRVTTGNANADAGRSSGAQVSLVTKSGTNQFHGSLYEYHRPTFTVANDWFNKQAQYNADTPNIPGKLIRNIFGGAVGGPILRDKLFFFGNYEGSRQAENAQVNQTTPFAAYQSGNLSYADPTGATQTLTPAQVTTLDSGCQVCNTEAYTPGPGPDPNALAYFKQLPVANGSTLGDGVTTGSYSFSSPNPVRLNTTIARIDYNLSAKHRIFVRGNFQKDVTGATEQFPGQGPSSTLSDNTKGITAGDTWTISPSMVNDLRYGYIRQGYSNRGVGSGDYVDFRFISSLTAETRTSINSVPVNNIVDNFSWSKGKHSISLGGNWRLVHQNNSTNNNSFNSASSNPYWLGGNPPDPASLSADQPTYGNFNAYLIAYANLVGVVPSVTDVYNYKIDSPTSASLLPEGAFLNRHFKANEFEYYVQDSWRLQPNLTLTFGMRHTILQTPYETTGQQVAPTIDTHAWFMNREASAVAGQVYEPDLQFAPTGPHYGKPGYWPKSKNNIAPRFAVAYSPDPKTSIRAGAGIYFDHYGEGLINAFDQHGSFGVSSQVTNQAGVQTVETSPRFTDQRTLPFNNGTAPPTQSFPFTAPLDNFAITTGLDSRIKTPYSESFDLSIQHEFPAGLTFELAYVGRLGRHLLQNLDLAEPTDFNDPAGGGDYYAAATQLSKLVDATGADPTASVAPIPFFEDLFPYMAGFDTPGESATQAIYSDEWVPSRANLGATTALADLDFYCYGAFIGANYPCPANHQPRFWQDQFASLFALSSMGTSSYHAAQFSLKHPSSHGLQFDVSYTFSKTLDLGSDSEANNFASGNNFGIIFNTWKPKLNKGPADFDARHLITGSFVYQLPVGQGKHFLGTANALTEALIGGWQLSGIVRATSGLPFSLFEPGYTTNWTYGSYAVVTGNVKMRRHYDQNGDPQYFDDPTGINNGTTTGTPIRFPYPGEAGERNNFRGDGYFGLDDGLSKTWKLERYGALKFAWEVYNVTNTVRFDPASIGSGLTGGNLGVASRLLTKPRVMQFSLRYDF